MDPFSPIPPEWTQSAIHSFQFSCPRCRASSLEAERVWINRRSPVYTEDYHKKWQEFYQCACGCPWWAWSSDRPSPEWLKAPDLE